MTRAAPPLRDAVGALVARVLGVAGTAHDLRRQALPEWDSLKHVEIVFALEDAYNMQFDESEFAALDSVDAIVALLERRLDP